jgi:hypothetical protein
MHRSVARVALVSSLLSQVKRKKLGEIHQNGTEPSELIR